MFYTIYKITNTIENKIYIGKHKTSNLNDRYMGSGKLISESIKKFEVKAFEKEILFIFETEDEMNQKERELVDENFVLDPMTYNLCLGGIGGWSYVNNNPELVEKRDRYENKLKGRLAADKVIIQRYGSISANSNKAREKALENWKIKYENNEEFRKHVKNNAYKARQKALGEEAKEKRKQTFKTIEHQAREKNSQYGTRWIHSLDLKISKKIRKTDVLPEGWKEGRKIKFDLDLNL